MVSGCRVSMGPLNKNEDKEKVWGGERKERNAIVSSSVLSVFMGLLSLALLFLFCFSLSLSCIVFVFQPLCTKVSCDPKSMGFGLRLVWIKMLILLIQAL